MKMISSTRKMSVSGVMLISATMSSPSPRRLGRELDGHGGASVAGAGGAARRLDVEQRLHEALAGAREAGAVIAAMRMFR